MTSESTLAEPIGLVLAGGLGRRLGRTKGDLRIEGQCLAQRASEVLAPLCRAVLISIRAQSANPAPQCIAIEDRPPAGRGPLAGIYRAFEATEESDLIVLACDYPRVETPILRRLLDLAGAEDEVVLPVDRGGEDHPLVAIWRRCVAGRVCRALDEGRFAVHAVLDGCRALRAGPNDFPGLDLDASLINVNTPEDLARVGES